MKKELNGNSLLGDVSSGAFRPLVPTALRHRVFLAVHNIGHPGMRATRRLISSRFCWRGLAKEVSQWARECVACQRSKVVRHVSLPPAAFVIPSRRFQHVHVDLVGPLPMSQGKSYIFTIIDRTSRWAEAVPLAETSAASCAAALCAVWVCRFGVPETRLSLQTGGHSLLQQCGQLYVPCSVQHTRSPPLTILRATAWWRDGTAG